MCIYLLLPNNLSSPSPLNQVQLGSPLSVHHRGTIASSLFFHLIWEEGRGGGMLVTEEGLLGDRTRDVLLSATANPSPNPVGECLVEAGELWKVPGLRAPAESAHRHS